MDCPAGSVATCSEGADAEEAEDTASQVSKPAKSRRAASSKGKGKGSKATTAAAASQAAAKGEADADAEEVIQDAKFDMQASQQGGNKGGVRVAVDRGHVLCALFVLAHVEELLVANSKPSPALKAYVGEMLKVGQAGICTTTPYRHYHIVLWALCRKHKSMLALVCICGCGEEYDPVRLLAGNRYANR